jgi:DNA-3-methyladenine glycosylase
MLNMILGRKFYQQNTLRVAQDLLGCILVRQSASGRRQKTTRAVITETEAYMGEDDLASHASKGRTPRTELMYGEAGRAYIYMIYGMYHCLNVVTEKKDFPAAVLIRGIELINDSPFKKGRPASTRKDDCLSTRLDSTRLARGGCSQDRGIYEAKKFFQIPPSPLASIRQNVSLSRSGPFPKGEINLDGPGKLCKFLEIDRKLNGWDMTQGDKIWIEKPARNATHSVAGGSIVAGRRIGIDYAKHCQEYLWRFNLDAKH